MKLTGTIVCKLFGRCIIGIVQTKEKSPVPMIKKKEQSQNQIYALYHIYICLQQGSNSCLEWSWEGNGLLPKTFEELNINKV